MAEVPIQRASAWLAFPVRILLANSFFFPAVGGIENYLLNVGRELVAAGHEVVVLAGRHEAHLSLEDSVDDIRVVRYHFELWDVPWDLLNVPRRLAACRAAARKLLTQETFDAVWVRDATTLSALQGLKIPPPVLYIQAVAWPLYLRAAHERSSEARLRSQVFQYLSHWVHLGMYSWIESGAIRAAEGRVVLSNAMRDELVAHYKVHSDFYRVIPAGVAVNRFQPVSEDQKRALRRTHGIPEDAFLFLYVGRFSPEKNPDAAVRAFRAIRDVSGVALAMVGPMPLGFSEEAAAAGLPGPLFSPGVVSEPSAWYQMADAHLLPSLTEGFGQVTLEAMASGLPVLGFLSEPGGSALATPEIVESGSTGLLVPYGDESALSAAMTYFVENPQRAVGMGREGRRVCEDKFSWTHVMERLIALSRDLRTGGAGSKPAER